jgi:hypothetical protein
VNSPQSPQPSPPALMTTSKKIVVLTALIAAACGVFSEIRLVARHDEQLKTQRKKAELLIAEIQQARAERDDAKQAIASAQQNAAAASTDTTAKEASANSAPDAGAKIWLARLQYLKQQLALHPEQQIPELKLLTDKDWLQIAQSAQLGNNDQILAAFADLRATAKTTFANQVRATLKKFTQASGGELPTDTAQLSAFGDPPLDTAMLARYTMARTGKVDSINEMLVVEKSPDNATPAEGRLSVSLSGLQTETMSAVMPPGFPAPSQARSGAAAPTDGFVDVTPALSQEIQQELAQATEAYVRAHNGNMPAQLGPEDLRPYAKDPAKIDEFLRVLKAEADKHSKPGG